MKFIFLIIISIGFSFPPSFNLDRNAEIVNEGLPDNGIIDIEAILHNQLYFGTSSGLGRVDINGEELIFSTVMNNAMPEGGNPALTIDGNVIAVSGVTTYYSAATESNEPKGTGIAYSVDYGDTWKFMEQPIVENPEEGLFHQIEWGGQTLQILAVTTAVNNVSYDLAIGESYIYSTSWAGGLQRFDYINEEEPFTDLDGNDQWDDGEAYDDINENGQWDDEPQWEIIPLPMDDQDSLICGDIDIDVYELNPKDPGDGGNHNHKGFSVFIEDEIIWVGTANGLNKGVIVNDCIEWTHFSTADGLTGNWVVGIDFGLSRLWAITWATVSTESTGLSYSFDHGVTWQYVDFFTNNGTKVYNLEISQNRIYASTIEGLYVSEDGEHWELIPDFIDSTTGETILDDAVYTAHVPYGTYEVWVGTGDGLAIRDSNGFVDIHQFWEATVSPENGDFNFSVYPNPFYVKDHNVRGGSGHVRFVYNVGSNSIINIYDFSMDHVVKLSNSHSAGNNGESEMIWDGRNSRGKNVANGVYFCKLTASGQDYWTKLVVIN
ncbi:MAG: hypothetical protein HN820_00760 [Candidatus Marinimicrobia bacterium]|nr:hypothetical protein [Candidatus Neomarinimicrobiota bacterium]MBT7376666.1 hypothetical protein [Candidatus Neomarinimicrobiota bacterium]